MRKHTTTSSSPFHVSLLADHWRSFWPKEARRRTNTHADPTKAPRAAIQKPFIPNANPHSVTTVVWPMSGGNEIITETE